VKHLCRSAALLALAVTSACFRQTEQQLLYSPTEAGLTLIFENPSDIQEPVQLRVRYAKQTSDGLEVACSVTSLKGTADTNFLCRQDGGIYSITSGETRTIIVPPEFPNKTASWQTGGISYRVIGRAKLDFPGIALPEPIGVWVEAIPVSPQLQNSVNKKAHVFFLPGIGEAETRVLRQGNWVTVNRLAGMGFTDVL
jgi:hypothetical protein